jgi:hypothetical protein
MTMDNNHHWISEKTELINLSTALTHRIRRYCLQILFFALWPVCLHAQATITATSNGAWSNPATWDGSVPSGNDTVIIPAGRTVTLDGGLQ